LINIAELDVDKIYIATKQHA